MRELTEANIPQARLSARGQLLFLAVCLAIAAWLGFWAYAVLADVPATNIGAEADTLPGSSGPDRGATQVATVRIDPLSSTVTVGQIFTITVAIDNVTNLGGFEFELKYTEIITPTNITDSVRLGPFLGSTGRTVNKIGPSFSEGLIKYAALSLPPPANGPSGSGTLATITFEAVATGTTSLDLQNVQITDPQGGVLLDNEQDGDVTVTESQPGFSVHLPIILKNY